MDEFEEKYSQLLQDTKRFLIQQGETYGNVFYTEPIQEIKKINYEGSMPKVKLVSEPKQESSLFAEKWQQNTTLDGLNNDICSCLKCPLGKTRTKFVFGVGNQKAKLMFIGEAPGADEDAQGEPFVGRAGQLLNKILEAIQLKREDVYICNILKCRPPNNRDPQMSEVEQCIPYLWKQIDIVQPKIIVSLGRIAAQMLLNRNDSLTKLRSENLTYRNIPLFVTFHPAALLRNPNWKRPAWEDFKKIRSAFDSLDN